MENNLPVPRIELFKAKNKEFCCRIIANDVNKSVVWKLSKTYKRRTETLNSCGFIFKFFTMWKPIYDVTRKKVKIIYPADWKKKDSDFQYPKPKQ